MVLGAVLGNMWSFGVSMTEAQGMLGGVLRLTSANFDLVHRLSRFSAVDRRIEDRRSAMFLSVFGG